ARAAIAARLPSTSGASVTTRSTPAPAATRPATASGDGGMIQFRGWAPARPGARNGPSWGTPRMPAPAGGAAAQPAANRSAAARGQLGQWGGDEGRQERGGPRLRQAPDDAPPPGRGGLGQIHPEIAVDLEVDQPGHEVPAAEGEVGGTGRRAAGDLGHPATG